MRVTSPAPAKLWEGMYRSDSLALITEGRAWLECMTHFNGYQDASRYYKFDDGQRALLPMVRKSYLNGAWISLEAYPAVWGFSGLLGLQDVSDSKARKILADLQSTGAQQIFLRMNPLRIFRTEKCYAPFKTLRASAHILNLAGGFAQIWEKRFSSKTRNQVRKAERSGLEVKRQTGPELMPIFHELYLKSYERWSQGSYKPRQLARLIAKRRQPLKKFSLMAETLGNQCYTYVASHSGRPAAAIVVLQGVNAQYLYGAMDKEVAGPTCANDLLQKMAIEDACLNDCRYYHMGSSGSSEALVHFKQRFGADEHVYRELQYENSAIDLAQKTIRLLVRRPNPLSFG